VVEQYRPGFGDQHTIHRSWSMAKSFNQALAGILVRQGRLDVLAPAPVPQWADPNDPRHAITTDQLLRMASGLQWKEEYFAPDSDTLALLGGAGKNDMAAYAASKPLEVPPGSRVQYSTGGSCIVSGIIGSIVGHGDAYRSFIQTELLDPLGIPAGEVAPGFDGAGNLIGGSVFDTTARNFAKLGLLYLRGGVWDKTRVEPEGWVDYGRTPTPAPAGIPTYGAGWWPKKSDQSRFEAGGFGGQHIVVDPKKDLVVVVLSDRLDGKDGAFRDDVIDAFAGLPEVASVTPHTGGRPPSSADPCGSRRSCGGAAQSRR
jgi:CubicO group peptidase (beta-lactamase class C family)